MSDQSNTQIKEEPLVSGEAAPAIGADETSAVKSTPAAVEETPANQTVEGGDESGKTAPVSQQLTDDKPASDETTGKDTSAAPAESTTTAEIAPQAAPAGDDGEVAMETSTTDDKPALEVSKAEQVKEPSGFEQEQSMEASADQTASVATNQEQAAAAPATAQSTDSEQAPIVEPKKEVPSNEVSSNQADQQQTPPVVVAATNENKQPTEQQPQPPKQQTPQQPLATRQYLDATVVPILHSALSQLAKVRPDDPVAFLGKYLLDNKNNFPSESK